MSVVGRSLQCMGQSGRWVGRVDGSVGSMGQSPPCMGVVADSVAGRAVLGGIFIKYIFIGYTM